MKECIGNYFMRNGILEPVTDFDACFLSDPFYIYEVFRVIDGVALFFEDHHNRLLLTAKLSDMPQGLIPEDLPQKVQAVIRANDLEVGNMKIVMHHQQEGSCPTVFLIFITEHQYPTTEQVQLGVDTALFRGIRTNPNAKVMDVSLRNQTNRVKQQQDVYETLLVDQHHCITEGSRSNVFFIKDYRVITPPLEDVLPGVTRKHIIDLCKRDGIPVSEEKVAVEDLDAMDAVFISGTSRKVLAVKSIDNLKFAADHPVLRQIEDAFNQEVQQYITRHKI